MAVRDWWYWFTLPWTFRKLPQCYRSAIQCLACTFDPQDGPPPEGKLWHVQLWIDANYCGLGTANLEDADSGEPTPEWEVYTPTATTCNATPTVHLAVRPKRLGGFREAS